MTILNRYLPLIILASLVLGLSTGAILRDMDESGATKSIVEFFDVVGTMWMNALRMTVIPLVVPLLIGAIAGAGSGKAAGRLGLITFLGFLALVTVLAISGASLAPFLLSGLPIDASVTAQLRATVADIVPPAGDASISTWFKTLIPTNPMKAAADGTMLSIFVFAVAVGFATLAAPVEPRQRVITFCKTISDVMLIVVQGILLFAPIGIFALTLVVGAEIGSIAFSILTYLIAISASYHLIICFVLLAIAAIWGRLGIKAAFKGTAPSIFVAAGTSSSLVALPAMIEGARDVWKLPEQVYGFVLPFAVSTFKPSGAFSWPVGAYFVSLIYGVPLDQSQLALAAGYAILFNATVPGIPNGGFLVIAPMYITLGLPLEGLAILVATSPIGDRFSTMVNVIANMAMSAILARGAKKELATNQKREQHGLSGLVHLD
jgi:proton glutamate symport protein